MAEKRRLSFIIVPHGDLETRTYDISYGALKVLLVVGFVLGYVVQRLFVNAVLSMLVLGAAALFVRPASSATLRAKLESRR